jgi:hypothetical protein
MVSIVFCSVVTVVLACFSVLGFLGFPPAIEMYVDHPPVVSEFPPKIWRSDTQSGSRRSRNSRCMILPVAFFGNAGTAWNAFGIL